MLCYACSADPAQARCRLLHKYLSFAAGGGGQPCIAVLCADACIPITCWVVPALPALASVPQGSMFCHPMYVPCTGPCTAGGCIHLPGEQLEGDGDVTGGPGGPVPQRTAAGSGTVPQRAAIAAAHASGAGRTGGSRAAAGVCEDGGEG